MEELKRNALAASDDFIKFLRDPRSRDAFPKLQEIIRVPDLDVNRYQIRLTRRANTRFEQNLDYLLGRVQEVQSRLPLMSAPRCSADISISNEILKSATSGKRPFSEIRNGFLQVLNDSGPLSGKEIDTFINPNPPQLPPIILIPSTSQQATVHQPHPRQTTRFNSLASGENFTNMNPIDNHHVKSSGPSRSSSVPPVPLISTPVSLPSNSTSTTPSNIKIRIRKPSSQAPENTSITHNIPWSDDEKQKLAYFLTVFPEEEVQARRYAKIDSALGTRTGNQVASRIQKIGAKALRQKERELKNSRSATTSTTSSSSIPPSLDKGTIDLVQELEEFFSKSTDPKIKETSEYLEYLRLKNQLEAIAKNPINGVLHVGFKCDSCGIEPIIGARWTCRSCPKTSPAIDLCNECVSKGFERDPHKLSHVMKKIEFSEESSPIADSADDFYL